MDFSPSRLRTARSRRGAKVKDLVEKTDLTRQTLAAFASGKKAPSREAVVTIANALEWPVEFFYGPDVDEARHESTSFRSLSTMSVGQRDTVLAAATLAFIVNDALEAKFNLPPSSVPDLDESDPEVAAASLRAMWGLGEAPISNVVHLLEAKGVRVFSLPVHANEVQAFATWHAATPFVFLNTWKTAEGCRFDAAHELGHLVLHRHGEPHGKEVEHQANKFASAFLMPRATVLATTPRFATTRDFFTVKHRWGTSVASVVRRLRDLQMLSDGEYQAACIAISSRGWRTSEPEPMKTRETSLVLRKIFDLMREDGIGVGDFARALSVKQEDVDLLLRHLVMRVAQTSDDAPPSSAPQVPVELRGLRLVHSR